LAWGRDRYDKRAVSYHAALATVALLVWLDRRSIRSGPIVVNGFCFRNETTKVNERLALRTVVVLVAWTDRAVGGRHWRRPQTEAAGVSCPRRGAMLLCG
jgi:hypothetical protein